MAVLPIFCCYVLFLESKWQRQEGVFTVTIHSKMNQ